MTYEKRVFGGLEPFDLVAGGTRTVNGRTWHVAKDPGHMTAVPVECYEIEWDSEGQGRATGNRKLMTAKEAQDTQVEVG